MKLEPEPAGMSWQAFMVSGFALAGLSAMLFATIAGWFGRKGESRTGPRWGGTLGLGLGSILSIEVIRETWSEERPRQVFNVLKTWWTEGGDFPLFPLDSYWWISWVVLAAMILGLFDGDFPAPRWARWENRSIVVGLLLWLVVLPIFGATWTDWKDAASLFGLGVGLFAWWSILEVRAEQLGPSMPLVLLLPTVALSGALLLAHAATLAAMAGGIAAALGAIWVVSWANTRMCMARGAIPSFVIAFAGLTLCGVYGNEMPKPVAILLAIAPLASLIDRVLPIANHTRWKQQLVYFVSIAIPLAVALGWAYAKVPPEIPM